MIHPKVSAIGRQSGSFTAGGVGAQARGSIFPSWGGGASEVYR
jgi:hypothetical protein